MKKLLLLVFICVTQLVQAQISENITLRDHWNDPNLPGNESRFSDCWGLTVNNHEIAVIGSIGANHFFDITDPDNIINIGNFPGENNTIWRQHKSYKNRIYAVSDQSPEGLYIFDCSAAPDSVVLKTHTKEFMGTCHMPHIDEKNGRLYLAGTNTQSGGLIVLDIKTNPDAPILLASVPLPGGGYVHDLYVRDNIAYCSHGYNGMYVWDMKDPVNPVLIASRKFNGYNHSSWLDASGKVMINAEEVPANLPLLMLDMTKLFSDHEIGLFSSTSEPIIEDSLGLVYHNPYIVAGNLGVVSAYEDGIHVYDISNPALPNRIGYYDTYPDNIKYLGNYNGCWGVYPFFPSGNWIASDRKYGLFVLKYTGPTTATPPAITPSTSNTLSFFPNPAKSVIVLQLSETELAAGVNYRIMDAKGALAQEGTTTSTRLDVSNLSPGNYWIECKVGEQLLHNTLVKQ